MTKNYMVSQLNNCTNIFRPLFCHFLPFYSPKFFPANDNFLGPLLSYLAENSAIWQQWLGLQHGHHLLSSKLFTAAASSAYNGVISSFLQP
jgi:hypothetical protein